MADSGTEVRTMQRNLGDVSLQGTGIYLHRDEAATHLDPQALSLRRR